MPSKKLASTTLTQLATTALPSVTGLTWLPQLLLSCWLIPQQTQLLQEPNTQLTYQPQESLGLCVMLPLLTAGVGNSLVNQLLKWLHKLELLLPHLLSLIVQYSQVELSTRHFQPLFHPLLMFLDCLERLAPWQMLAKASKLLVMVSATFIGTHMQSQLLPGLRESSPTDSRLWTCQDTQAVTAYLSGNWEASQPQQLTTLDQLLSCSRTHTCLPQLLRLHLFAPHSFEDCWCSLLKPAHVRATQV